MKLGRKGIEDKHPEIMDLLLRLRSRDAEHGRTGSYKTTRSYTELAEALRDCGYVTERHQPLSKSTIGRLMQLVVRSQRAEADVVVALAPIERVLQAGEDSSQLGDRKVGAMRVCCDSGATCAF